MANKQLMVSALISAAALPFTANAQDHKESHKLELHLGAGRTFFEEPLENANHLNLGLGYVLNERWTLDAIASGYSTDTETGAIEIDGRQYRLDMLYHLDTVNAWRPYLAFGVGDQEREADGAEGVRDTLLNLGAGAKRRLGNNWEFRTDVRAFNSLDEEYTDVALNLGISYLFGAKPVKKAPTPAPVVATAQEADSDGDGVLDSQDKCPGTARQYKVDADGCPMKLTETVSVNLAVKFDTNSAVVKEEYMADINNLATFMNQYANTVVTVEGHTDSSGSDAYNKTLSQRRADAVRDVLVQRMGIEADRVTAVGYGEERPIADNESVAGREQNRRVVGAVSTKITTTETR